jgi:hypothetical protein
VAEDTNEEGVSKRRYGDDEEKIKRLTVVDGNGAKPKDKAAKGKYPNARPRIPKAAESLGDWD